MKLGVQVKGYKPGDRISGGEFLTRYRSLNPEFRLVVVDDNVLPRAHAEAYPELRLVKVRRSLFRAFQQGENWAVLIVLEELCHDLLKHEGALHRSNGVDIYARANSRKAAQEREAKYLAAAIIAPRNESARLSSPEEIANTFGLGPVAAKIRFEEVGPTRRRLLGIKKELSEETKKKMRQLEQETGHRLKSVDLTSHSAAVPVDIATTRSLDQLPHPLKQYFSRNGPPTDGFSEATCPECGSKMQIAGGGCITCYNCGSSDCN